MIESIREASDFLISKGVHGPEVGVILGTGLGRGFVSQMEDPIVNRL